MKDLTDSHGSINILSEGGWKNVVFISVDNFVEISGTNLNALLKGLFLLFSLDGTPFLPGAPAYWEDIVPASFTCLNQLCTMEEIMSRVFQLLVIYNSNQSKLNLSLLQGAVWFLHYWINQFSDFISEKEKLIFHIYLKSLLKALLSNSYLFKEDFIRLLRNVVSCVQNQLFPHKEFLREPNILISEGAWDGNEILSGKDRSAALKAEFSQMPKIKLEIFGADLLFDSDEDENDDNSIQPTTKENLTNLTEKIISYPLARVSKGINLLDSDSIQLLEMDTMELARQWTLLDHEIFKLIPFNELLCSCFSTSSAEQQPNNKLFDNIRLNGMKKLVDQFNAASLWVSNAILLGESMQERARSITKFIHLANEFHKLGNFHGLMVILTALQQGCITRLVNTFSVVGKSDLSTLNSLKVIFR
jgi:hypothetical protein